MVQSVDEIEHLLLVRTDSGQNEQVLEVPVVGEVSALQDDALEQLDELLWHVGVDESLNRGGDLIRVLGLRKGSLHDLVDEGTAMWWLLVLSVFWRHEDTADRKRGVSGKSV